MGLKVKFSQLFLNDLVQNSDDSGVIVEANRTKYLNVSPFQLENLKEFITEYLDSLVGKYDPELSGIILSHRKIRIDPQLTVQGDGINKLLYIADIYVFKPKLGSVLTGVVNKKSEDHIGCLVHRVFNIAIPRPNGIEEGAWKGTSVSVGQDVRFKVVNIDMSESIPYIRGELIDILASSTSKPTNSLENSQSSNKEESINVDRHEKDTSVKSDSESDAFSDLNRVKTQKPSIGREISKNRDQNLMNDSYLLAETSEDNDEVTNRTLLSPRKSVDSSKNEGKSSISPSRRKMRDTSSLSPTKCVERSKNESKTSISSSSKLNDAPEIESDGSIPMSPKKLTNEAESFENNDEENLVFDVSPSKITIRTRKNNLWINDESFGNVSKFLNNLDSPQSCLRKTVSPSSVANSPGNDEKGRRSVRFSSENSVLKFGSQIESLNDPMFESKNEVVQEVMKSPEKVSDSSNNLEADKSVSDKLLVNMKSLRATGSPKNIEPNKNTDGDFEESNQRLHEKIKLPKKEGVVSKDSEPSKNINSDSDSTDEDIDTKDGKFSKNSKTSDNITVNSISSDNHQRKEKSLLEEMKSPVIDTKALKKSKTPSNISVNTDCDSNPDFGRIERKEIKSSGKDAKTSKNSPSPKNIRVNSAPASTPDVSFENRMKTFLESTKVSEKHAKVSMSSETPTKCGEEFCKKLDFGLNENKNILAQSAGKMKGSKKLESPKKSSKPIELESNTTDGNTNNLKNDELDSIREYDKTIDSSNSSDTDNSAIVSNQGGLKNKEKSNRERDDAEKDDRKISVNDKTVESRTKVNQVERDTKTIKSLDNFSSNKSKHFSSIFGLADETHRRTKKETEERDKDGVRSTIGDTVAKDEKITGEKTCVSESSSDESSSDADNRSLASMKENKKEKEDKSKEKSTDFIEKNALQSRGNGGVNADNFDDDFSVGKTFRGRTASICEESTVTMLLKDAFTKFCGPKNRKSIENSVTSVEKIVDTVEDSNQDTDVEKLSKRSGKNKRKPIESHAISVEKKLVKDGSTVKDSDDDLETLIKKSGHHKHKSIESHAISVEKKLVKDDTVKDSDDDLETLLKKSGHPKRKSIETHLNSVENVVKNASTVEDSNEDTDVEKLIKKAKKKKTKEKELDNRKLVESEEVVEDEEMKNRNSFVLDSNLELDVEKMSKKMKKKKNKDEELDNRKLVESEKEDGDKEKKNRNSLVLDSNQEVDVEKLTKKTKKKKNKENELDCRKSIELAFTGKENDDQENRNKNSLVLDLNQELGEEKVAKKIKKKKNKEKELDDGKSIEIEKKIEDQGNKNRNRFELDVANRSALDGYITDYNSSRHKSKKKSNFKKKDEGYDSEFGVEVQESSSVSTVGDGDFKKKHKSKKSMELFNVSQNDEGGLVVKGTSDANNEKCGNFKVVDNVCDNYGQEKQTEEQSKKIKKRKSRETREIVEDSPYLTNLAEMKEQKGQKAIEFEKKENKIQKKKHQDSFGVEDSNDQTENDEKRQESVEIEKKKEKIHRKKHQNSGVEETTNQTRSSKQFTLDGYITDCSYSKHKLKKSSDFKLKRDGYASDFEASKQDSLKNVEDSKKKHRKNKSFDVENIQANTTLDDFIIDCNFSKHKSKKLSDLKLKTEGYASDFEACKEASSNTVDKESKKKHGQKKSLDVEGENIQGNTTLDDFIIDCNFPKHKSKRSSDFKLKRDEYGTDFEDNKQASLKNVEEESKKKNRRKKFLDVEAENIQEKTSLDGYITDCNFSKHKSKKLSDFKKKQDEQASDFEDLMKKHKRKKSLDANDQSFPEKTFLDGYITDCNFSKNKSKKSSDFKLKRDGYASDFEASKQATSKNVDEDSKKKYSKKKSLDVEAENIHGKTIFDGYVTDCNFSKHKSKKLSDFKMKQDENASDFEFSTKKHKRKKSLDANDQHFPEKTFLDGYITDCNRSKNKSKKSSEFKLKQDGYVNEFQPNLQIPTYEELTTKKKKKKKHKESIEAPNIPLESSFCKSKESTNEVKQSEKYEKNEIENQHDGDISGNVNGSTHEELTKKKKKKKKKHKENESIEASNISCENEAKMLETSLKRSRKRKHSEKGCNEDDETTDGITKKFKLDCEFIDEARCLKKSKKGKCDKELNVEELKVDKHSINDNLGSSAQGNRSHDVSRKRRKSDIEKGAQSNDDFNCIPTKKIKVSSSHELEMGMVGNRGKYDENEQKPIAGELQSSEMFENVGESDKKNKKKRCRKKRSFSLDKSVSVEFEQSDKNEELTEEKKKRSKNKETNLENSVCEEIDRSSLEESWKKEKNKRKSGDLITSKELPKHNKDCDVVSNATEPVNATIVSDFTFNQDLQTVDKTSRTPKKSTERTSKTKTPKKSKEDPKQEKIFKFLSPVKKMAATLDVPKSSVQTVNLEQSIHSVSVSSFQNFSNRSKAENNKDNVEQVLSYPTGTSSCVSTEETNSDKDSVTSKKKKKKLKRDKLFALQQDMINRVLQNKKKAS